MNEVRWWWCYWNVVVILYGDKHDDTVPRMHVLRLFRRHLITKSWLISTPSHRPKPFQPSEQEWWGTWGTHKQLGCLVPNLPSSRMPKCPHIPSYWPWCFMKTSGNLAKSDKITKIIPKIINHSSPVCNGTAKFDSFAFICPFHPFSTSVPGPKQVGLEPPLQVVGLPWPELRISLSKV